jgi:uncharacterized membrane protein
MKQSEKSVVKNVNDTHNEQLSKMDQLALKITNKVGTMGFFGVVFAWTLLWLGWNLVAPKELVFDPVPACVFWLFISNMIQIFLMPLLMIGQNLQSKHSELRAEADFAINTKAELEIEDLQNKLNEQGKKLDKVLEILSKK